MFANKLPKKPGQEGEGGGGWRGDRFYAKQGIWHLCLHNAYNELTCHTSLLSIVIIAPSGIYITIHIDGMTMISVFAQGGDMSYILIIDCIMIYID